MAGLQFFCRKLLGTSRLVNKKSIFIVPSRGKHNLIFRVSVQQNGIFSSKSSFVFSSNRHCFYRLASTNLTDINEILKTNDTVKLNNEVHSETEAPVIPPSKVEIDENSLPPIPSLEEVTPATEAFEFVSTGLKEASFESLGLLSYYPSGLLRGVLEDLHIGLDLPWWGAIALLTLALRILTFPVYISARKDIIHMTNHMPQMSDYQQRIDQAKKSGDYYLAASLMQEFQQLLKEKNIKLTGFLKTMFFQAPVFLSMFWGLRAMAEVPVASLKDGGLFWFSDLTVPDPYFILPAFLGGSIWAVLYFGAEGVSSKTVRTPIASLIVKGVPILIFGVATQFSTCITWYWTISNVIVLFQTYVLSFRPVSNFFGIPERIPYEPPQNQVKKNFIEQFKEGIKNAKIQADLEERRKLNAIRFENAGTAPIPRTFDRNPKLMAENKSQKN